MKRRGGQAVIWLRCMNKSDWVMSLVGMLLFLGRNPPDECCWLETPRFIVQNESL